MKLKQKVLRNGGGLYVCIPKIIVEALNLAPGSLVEVKRLDIGFIVTKIEDGKEARNIFDS